MYFRKSCKAFYVNRTGFPPQWLGTSVPEAEANLKRLEAGEKIIRPGKAKARSKGPTVQDIVDRFMDDVKAHRSPSTYEWYRNYLTKAPTPKKPDRQTFCYRFGTLPVADLEKHHVKSWIEQNGWTGNSAHAAARTIVAVRTDIPAIGAEVRRLQGDDWPD